MNQDDMTMIRMTKSITLPFWDNPYGRWFTLKSGSAYSIPKVWADSLRLQGYIASNDTTGGYHETKMF